jgi:hypothetical protein
MGVLRHRPRRPVGWLVALALLLHGWLPILIQVSVLSVEASAHGDSHAHHAHHAGAPAHGVPDPAPAGKGLDCPVLHGAICLCAVLVKVLPPPVIAVPFVAAMARAARGRYPARRAPRQRQVALFEARAPPVSD